MTRIRISLLLIVMTTIYFSLSAKEINLSAQHLNGTPYTGDYPFQVKISGSGNRSLIFIPGLGCSGAVWDETLPSFEPSFTCYTLTMAGFGGAPAQEDPKLNSWVDGIAAYIRDKHIDKPTIIGHSVGGGLSLMLAARYPELIGKIIIVDALPCLGAATNPAFTVKADPHCEMVIDNMVKSSDQKFTQMQKMFINRLIEDTVHRAAIIDWGVRSDRKTFASIYCQFGNTDLRDTIKRIQCPALVLLESTFVQIKQVVEAQYSGLKGADLRYANKGLHFIMYDDKNWYLQQLNTFLKN